DVRRLLPKAHGCLEWPLERDTGPRDRLDRLGRDARRQTLLEDLGAGLAFLPGDPHAGRLDDAASRAHALRPDPVAGDERDHGRVRRRRGHMSSFGSRWAVILA